MPIEPQCSEPPGIRRLARLRFHLQVQPGSCRCPLASRAPYGPGFRLGTTGPPVRPAQGPQSATQFAPVEYLWIQASARRQTLLPSARPQAAPAYPPPANLSRFQYRSSAPPVRAFFLLYEGGAPLFQKGFAATQKIS